MENSNLLFPPQQEPHPPIYFGGSSQAGIEAAAKHTDVYLTWGEPPEQVKEKIERSTAPFFNNTIGTLTVRYESELTQQMLPALLDKLLEGISSNLESVLKRLRLEEIVKEQVDQFPVERLEEMVLSISKKEFKMITYLGGLLGGIIGAIQALFVILF